MTMENQYCRVGTVTPITSGSQAAAILERRYQNFMEKASSRGKIDSRLADFFESKTKNIKKALESLL